MRAAESVTVALNLGNKSIRNLIGNIFESVQVTRLLTWSDVFIYWSFLNNQGHGMVSNDRLISEY